MNRKNLPAVDLPNEVWKDIPGFEGFYMVSNHARVKSFCQNPKILRPGYHAFGYLKYTLMKEGKMHYVSLHRLIASAFIPNPKNLPCVNHIDGNPANNSAGNLEWCSFSHNSRHAFKMGRLDFSGQRNGQAKLTSGQVVEIFSSHAGSHNLAIKFSVSQQTINDIRSGRRWSHITGKRHPSVKRRIVEENLTHG